jgi:hypothetical protein
VQNTAGVVDNIAAGNYPEPVAGSSVEKPQGKSVVAVRMLAAVAGKRVVDRAVETVGRLAVQPPA